MAEYNPKRMASWNYGGKQWKLSRSKISLFKDCPRCFYIDNKLGTKRPPIPSFLINSAVDHQLKKEFDIHRYQGTQHPLQIEFKVDAKPAEHDLIDQWRENFKGVQYHDKELGFVISGAIDDLWVNSDGEHFIVDYKATAKKEPVVRLEGKWHEGYKRQIEVYQWLIRKNGLKVSNIGYFVYCTGILNQPAFDKKIEFDAIVIDFIGDDSWVEPTIKDIKKCLDADELPDSGEGCEHCAWFNTRVEYEK